MDSLVRAIQDLDPIRFQELCFHILSEKYPSAGIRYVEGIAGDEGVDAFSGQLTHGPTVWQCKAFQSSMIGKSQKSQIRESLRRVMAAVAPRVWVLCLNINLDSKAHRWFERLRGSYTEKVGVADAMQAADIAKELMFRKTLRQRYFPQLDLQVAEIRALMAGVADLSDQQLQKKANETVQQWIDRMKESDARIAYEITFGGERGPTPFPPPDEPGLLMAATDGQATVKAYARDVEALRLDPWRFSFKVIGEGKQKLMDLFRTGRDPEWRGSEIAEFSTNVPMLRDLQLDPRTRITFQSVPTNHDIPLRFTFRNANGSSTLEYVPFRRKRAGNSEVEIETPADVVLPMRLIIPLTGGCLATVTIRKNFVGQSLQKVAQACKVLQLLQQGCEIEMYSLALSSKLGVLKATPIAWGLEPSLVSLISDLMIIGSKFGVKFQMPEDPTLDDEGMKVFLILRGLAMDEPIKLETFTFSLVKSRENEFIFPQKLQSEGTYWIEHDNGRARLFGKELLIGRFGIHIERSEVNELSETLERFGKAQIGEPVSISLKPLRPVKFVLLPSASAATKT